MSSGLLACASLAFGFRNPHYIGVVAPAVPEPVSAWHWKTYPSDPPPKQAIRPGGIPERTPLHPNPEPGKKKHQEKRIRFGPQRRQKIHRLQAREQHALSAFMSLTPCLSSLSDLIYFWGSHHSSGEQTKLFDLFLPILLLFVYCVLCVWLLVFVGFLVIGGGEPCSA